MSTEQEPAPSPQLPAEVREIVKSHVKFSSDARKLCAALAPFFAAPQSSGEARGGAADAADVAVAGSGDCVEKVAEEIWDCAFDAYCTHNGGTTAHESAHNAVAAILRKHFGSEADELRRRDEEIARLTEQLRIIGDMAVSDWNDTVVGMANSAVKECPFDQRKYAERVRSLLERARRTEKAEAELTRIQSQTRWQCQCGGTDCDGRRENERLRAQLAALKAEVERLTEWKIYAEGHGLLIALNRTADCPEGRLAHEYREGSTLHRMFEEWSDTIAYRAQLAASEQRLKEAEEDSRRLGWLCANHYMVDFINEDREPTARGAWICTDGDDSHTSASLRAPIDAARNAAERSEGRSASSTGGVKP